MSNNRLIFVVLYFIPSNVIRASLGLFIYYEINIALAFEGLPIERNENSHDERGLTNKLTGAYIVFVLRAERFPG